MTEYYKNIIKLREDNKIYKYKNELEGNLILTEESKEYINSILNNIKTKSNKKLNTVDGIFNEMDNLVYKRYWHKLKPIHQKMKLTEYIKNLNISNKLNENKLINNLYDLIDKKILTKKKLVDYDPFKACITNINILTYNEKKDTYKIDC